MTHNDGRALREILELLTPKDRELFTDWLGGNRENEKAVNSALSQAARTLRKQKARALEEGIKAARSRWLPALRSSNREVRTHAAIELSRYGKHCKEAIPPLLEALEGPGARVRALAASSLAHMGSTAEAAVPDLLEALDDSDLYVRRNAIKALVAIKPDDRKVQSAGIFAVERETKERLQRPRRCP